MPGFGPSGRSSPVMSRERCAGLCYDTEYTVAGVENGTLCFCSNATTLTVIGHGTSSGGANTTIFAPVPPTPPTRCNIPCVGNHSESCGGACSADVFKFECVGPKKNASPTTEDYYAAMFKRIEAAYPIDYYWFWTPEGWEWGNVADNSSLVTTALADLQAASAAHAAVQPSFQLATCGWVLGPAGDRSLLDTKLGPEYAALASIEQRLGTFGYGLVFTSIHLPACTTMGGGLWCCCSVKRVHQCAFPRLHPSSSGWFLC